MTALSRAALEAEVDSLIADNTSGNITAADVRQVQNDTADSCFNITTDTFATIASGAISCSTISASGDVTIATGKAIQTDTTTAHTLLIKAYDVDGTAYKTFATLTNGNTPSLSIAAPSGGTVAIDGASIGAVTAGSGAFTTLAASGDVAIATNKFTVASASGNTLVAGTLSVTSDVAVATNKFTVAAATGNTLVAGTLAVTGVVTLTTYILDGVGNALTAAGTTRADALQLAKTINNVTTAASGTGVILPVGQVGMTITVFNAGANAIKVYASASETIDTIAGSTGVTLTNAKRCLYFFTAANTWVSSQLGVVSA